MAKTETGPGRNALFSFLFVAFSFLLAFGAGEIFVRVLGRYDIDGTFYFRGRPVPPFALPVRNAQRLLEEYWRDPRGYMAWDPDLGWTNRPSSCSSDGMYCANSAGLRADREYGRTAPPGVLRISLFGDSFIHGHDVSLAGSLAPQLEKALAARGIKSEVLNFGVGGFGIDQAYIRYSLERSRFDTGMVIEGLQFENVARHLMVFRLIAYPQTKIPFSKPRFYFDGTSLRVAGRPAMRPEDIPGALSHFERSPLRRFEAFYSDKYRRTWWRHSKLAAVLANAVEEKRGDDDLRGVMQPDGEGMRLTRAIVARFRDDVRSSGKPFILVYLPMRGNLTEELAGRADPWEGLLADFRRDFTVVDPRPRLLEIARRHGVDAVAGAHYTAAGNGAVAEALAEAIAQGQSPCPGSPGCS
jgi:hypothetical protein